MKKVLTFCIVALSVAMMPQTVSAQGILKKLNKGLEKVNKALDGDSEKADMVTGQAFKQENGITVYNPIKKAVDVELVGAFGVSTSENYGNVELVLKVTMKAPETSIGFGGKTGSQQTIAFDADGNSYKMTHTSTWTNFDVTEGLPVKIVLSGDDAFQKVRKTGVLPVVKLYTHIAYSSDKSGELQFKNVPVQWDVEH